LYEPLSDRDTCDNDRDHVMPDQSSAATEHAILQEITAPLENLPDDPVALVNADFPVALRGYDRLAVDAYVQRASQLVAELQATRSPEAAVRRALERVGEQISGILQRAHETAEEITAQSRREAEDRLEKSRVEAREIEAAAHQRVRDLDVDTDRIWAERGRIVDDARELAQQLIALAETAAERFPPASETTPYDDDASLTRAPITSGERAALDEDYEEPLAAEDEYEEPLAAEGEYEEPLAGEQDHEEPRAEEPARALPLGGDEPPADDLDQTVAFDPLAPSAGDGDDEDPGDQPPEEPAARDAEASAGSAEPAGPPPAPADHRRSSSVIPPASQAANRRSSR
jgi:cell division septum initiation protein DivIVA